MNVKNLQFDAPHDGDGNFLAESCRDGVLLVRNADVVDAAEEGSAVLNAADHHGGPERVELGPAVVEEPCEPVVERRGLRGLAAAVAGHFLVNLLLLDDFAQPLEICVVSRACHDRRVIHLEEVSWIPGLLIRYSLRKQISLYFYAKRGP